MENEEPMFAEYVPRNRLVSAMLQDRGVLRLLSAPHGFGKSMLAHEYGMRLFPREKLVWVDARAPEFLQALDCGRILSAGAAQAPSEGSLVVIDDIPYLDELRAKTLSDGIDALLYARVEVVVTTLPSHDVLRFLQPDRLLFRAGDLLVDRAESDALHPARTPEAGSLRVHTWRNAEKRLFGRVPAVFFSESGEAAQVCLAGFFSEKLPLEALRCVFAMLLVARGSFEDLDALGVGMRGECEAMLADDYAFLGLDATQRCFETPDVSPEVLRSCVEQAHVMQELLGCEGGFAGRALSLLMSSGQVERAGAALDVFFSDEECGLWLEEEGWELLDRGECALADKLFERCPARLLEGSRPLLALRAWASGLAGDAREAAYFAQTALQKGAGEGEDTGADEEKDARERLASACAHLALVAFDEGGPALYARGKYGTNAMPTCAADVFCAVIDECADEELDVAFGPSAVVRSGARGKLCREMEPSRLRSFEALLTAGEQRFGDSLWYRLSLHCLQSMNSVKARMLLQSLGAPSLPRMRRRGLCNLSEALLVCDLWEGGYFGAAGLRAAKRDLALLEGAHKVLSRAGALAGAELHVPWKEKVVKRTAGTGVFDMSEPVFVLEGAGIAKGAALSAAAAADPGATGASSADSGLVAVASAQPVPLLHVRMFGAFEVAVGEDLVLESQWRKKPRLLFIMLALRLGRDVTRQEIFAQLWPDFERTRALDNFYNAWSAMRRALGKGPYVQRSGDFCHIDRRFVKSDVGEFDRLTREILVGHGEGSDLLDAYSQVEAVYRGGLLPSERDSDFVDAQRAHYQQLFVDAMVAASFKAIEGKDARLALWFAHKAHEAQPRREDVYYALIRAQIEVGQRSSAVRSYEQCRSFLREDLGLDPCADVQALYDRLVTADPALVGFTAARAYG